MGGFIKMEEIGWWTKTSGFAAMELTRFVRERSAYKSATRGVRGRNRPCAVGGVSQGVRAERRPLVGGKLTADSTLNDTSCFSLALPARKREMSA